MTVEKMKDVDICDVRINCTLPKKESIHKLVKDIRINTALMKKQKTKNP